MNLYTAAALLQPSITTCVCEFSASPGQPYTYLVPKELNVQAGDTALVRTKSTTGMKICSVMEVHEECQADPSDSPMTYQWVVQKVDLSTAMKYIDMQEKTHKLLLDKQRAHMRAEVLRGLNLTDADSRLLDQLAIK